MFRASTWRFASNVTKRFARSSRNHRYLQMQRSVQKCFILVYKGTIIIVLMATDGWSLLWRLLITSCVGWNLFVSLGPQWTFRKWNLVAHPACERISKLCELHNGINIFPKGNWSFLSNLPNSDPFCPTAKIWSARAYLLVVCQNDSIESMQHQHDADNRSELRTMNLQWYLHLLVVINLPLQLLAFSGPARRNPSQHVRQNQWLSRDHKLLTSRNDCSSSQSFLGQRRFSKALRATPVPPIGLVRHVGILSLASLVTKGLKRKFLSNDAEQPQVGVMDRCPWPFIFFHDPKQGFKDPPTWTALLYITIWRCIKAYQAFKLSWWRRHHGDLLLLAVSLSRLSLDVPPPKRFGTQLLYTFLTLARYGSAKILRDVTGRAHRAIYTSETRRAYCCCCAQQQQGNFYLDPIIIIVNYLKYRKMPQAFINAKGNVWNSRRSFLSRAGTWTGRAHLGLLFACTKQQQGGFHLDPFLPQAFVKRQKVMFELFS